jgi:hypothetical protein
MVKVDVTDPRLDSQARPDQAVSGISVPPTLEQQSLPIPLPSDPGRERSISPVSATTEGDVESRSRFIGFVHEYVRDNIRLADQKATFFFTAATALVAFLYQNDVSGRWLKTPMDWNLLDVVAFLAMMGLAAGAFLALLVIIPRTPGSRRGFIFWEAIAEYSSGRDYSGELSALSPASLFQIKAEHTFELAKVCRRKYKMLRYALWTGAVGLVAALIVFLFLGS